MYWAVREDGTFEIIDGQQRTISICQYVHGEFSNNNLSFHNLQKDKQELILNYKLMVYLCTGTETDKLKWFETINIAGEKLTKQELRNAVYSGSWVIDAKRYFSKSGCVAHSKAGDYLDGSAIRQDYLETAIKWISEGKIEEYMSKNQHLPNAGALWRYFESVISWVEATFTTKRKLMKGIEWGPLYNKFKDEIYDAKKIESEIAQLIADEDVESKKGIYEYILTRDQKHLSIRTFSDSIKQNIFEKQGGVCVKCQKTFTIGQMQADHVVPWSKGGKTTVENCQMLCQQCNGRKSNK